MSNIVINVENLSKRYLIGQQRSKEEGLRHVFEDRVRAPLRWIRSGFRGNGVRHEEFWALREVNFDVSQGDVVGIIGRNGAGKSTLLKILSRVTEPTIGRVRIKGRVASLLEVGTGFHPELTGRENVHLNGAILGMRRAEIKRKFDEIVAFAEVERFLDTPVKRYSSGMQVRLAFAVAAHLEPEILVVDEVLAVGDAAFQKKCLGKMGNVVSEGRTVLFVSHNLAAVEQLCGKGVTLENGRVKYVGTQSDAIASYLSTGDEQRTTLGDREDRNGTGEIRVEAIEIVDELGKPLDTAVSGQAIGIRLHFTNRLANTSRVIVSVQVKTHLDVPVFLHHTRLVRQSWTAVPETGFFQLSLRKLPLPAAQYRIGYSVLQDGEYLDALDAAAFVTVTDGDFFGSGEVPPISHGVCLVEGSWSLQAVRALQVV